LVVIALGATAQWLSQPNRDPCVEEGALKVGWRILTDDNELRVDILEMRIAYDRPARK
jgi:hypothetical protein